MIGLTYDRSHDNTSLDSDLIKVKSHKWSHGQSSEINLYVFTGSMIVTQEAARTAELRMRISCNTDRVCSNVSLAH